MHSPIIFVPQASAALEPPTISIYANVDDAGSCVLQLRGEIDLAATDRVIAAGLRCLEQATVERLVIDLADVTFLDAGGLGALVVLRNASYERRKAVELRSIPARIDKLLRLTGLDAAFAAHPPHPPRSVEPLATVLTTLIRCGPLSTAGPPLACRGQQVAEPASISVT